MGRAAERNPHSMASDWPLADKSTWNGYQRFIDFAKVYPHWPDKPVPVHPMTDKVPYMSTISQHVFIIVFAAIPVLLHQAYCSYTGHGLGKIATFLLYNGAYVVTAMREVRMLRKLTHMYGCLDGEKARDGIPNESAGMIISEMHKTAGFRVAMAVFMVYNSNSSPFATMSDINWWGGLLAKLSLYGVILDFFFYSYHRACHELPGLWKYHRTHHLTKHPTAVLSAFADDEQEIIEMVIVPFLTFATLWAIGLPLGFYEWWFCFEYVTFSEIWGHSGLRIHGTAPSPISWLLQLLDCELAIEDHDMHHRKGWKKSFNYGKQTRVWDRLFGTWIERLETKENNIDYENTVWMPMF